MRFPTKFTRYKGGSPPAGSIFFGADVLPVDINGVQANPNVTADNVLLASMKNIDGWPPKRIAVACRYWGPNDPSVLALTGIMYFFDSNLGLWIAMQAAGLAIQPGKGDTLAHQPLVQFFDVVNISNQPSNGPNQQTAGAGSIAVCLIVTDPGGATVVGQYDFVMAASI